jgi:malate synthase
MEIYNPSPKKNVRNAEAAYPAGVRIRGPVRPGFEKILTKEALEFVAALERKFRPRVKYILELRKEQQARYDAGELPSFDPATTAIREGDWTCSSPPAAIADRRVEITGPVERKMVINALNCGAKMFMADFEDSLAPTWDNIMHGHINLRDAVNRTISYEDKARNKSYKLNSKTATLLVRPRGWHLQEAHIEIDGEPATGALMDFGFYFFHNHASFRSK